MRPRSNRLAIVLLAVAAVAVAGPAAAKAPSANEQLKFGVDMAKRGLWSEALFRFEQARRMSGGNARILNNLAVAYEAVGRFDDALAMYQKAVAANPGNRDLKKNFSQFMEFYQGFRPPEPEGTGASESDAAEGAPEDGS